MKSGIDQEALIQQFASASAKQTAQLHQAVHDATMRALQGRELSLANIRKVVHAVTQAATAGAAKNPTVNAETMLEQAVAGMDEAVVKAVDANRVALQQFVDRGAEADLQEADGRVVRRARVEVVAPSSAAAFGARVGERGRRP